MTPDIEALNKKIEDLDKEILPLTAKRVKLIQRKTKLVDHYYKTTDLSLAEMIEAFPDSMVKLKKLQVWAREHSMYVMGYYTATGQRCLNIRIDKGDPTTVAKVKAGILKLLCVYRKHDDVRIHFGILDHDLNETRNMVLTMDTEWSLINRRSSYPKPKTGTLDQMLQIIHDNYYYEDVRK